MENIMEKLTEDTINQIKNQENKNIVIETKEEITPEQRLAIESIKKLKNPFVMVGVDYIMRDLKICKSIAYRLFQNKDFPSIKVGKEHKIMLLSYLIWKMSKRD